MKQLAMLLTLLLAAFLAAEAQTPPAPPKPGPPMSAMMNCPMNLQGTSVAVADTPTGVTVTLTTKPENVAELRRRVEQMAAMHSGSESTDAMKQGQMMPGTVKYESIENGSRLMLTPKDPSKLADFRKQVRAHVERMQKGECSMMQDMMQGMMKGMGNAGKPNEEPQPKSEPKNDDTDHSAHHPEGRK